MAFNSEEIMDLLDEESNYCKLNGNLGNGGRRVERAPNLDSTEGSYEDLLTILGMR